MATAIKKCKVCGKEYEYCHTAKSVADIFRWQDVACSPECGAIYLAKVRASRQAIPVQTETPIQASADLTPTVTSAEVPEDDIEEDEEDIEDEDWFEDEEDEEE